jgi:hypothetical protein
MDQIPAAVLQVWRNEQGVTNLDELFYAFVATGKKNARNANNKHEHD